MISRSQMRRQLYQNAGMVSPMQQGIGSMMPAGAQQGQAPKKDYAKIKKQEKEKIIERRNHHVNQSS